jgi:hypothetical protein
VACLNGGKDCGCWGFFGEAIGGIFGECFEEGTYGAQGLFRWDDLGAGSDRAEDGIGDDLFDEGGGFGGAGLFGEVEAGDLEAIEEEAGPFGVDLVAGDAAEDLADGVLDGGAVFGQREVEVGLTAAAVAWIFDGAAGGVVVVTKFFMAQAWAAAAAAVDEDVAALEAFGGVGHGGLPRWHFWLQSIQNKRPAAGLRRRPHRRKKARNLSGLCFFF